MCIYVCIYVCVVWMCVVCVSMCIYLCEERGHDTIQRGFHEAPLTDVQVVFMCVYVYICVCV